MFTAQDLIDSWRLHPDPEVGSCANQLAGVERSLRLLAHAERSRLRALVATWRERKHAGEFSIVDGEADLTKCADELDALLVASRGGGDTRPPRADQI
jgi:hypothetical protein